MTEVVEDTMNCLTVAASSAITDYSDVLVRGYLKDHPDRRLRTALLRVAACVSQHPIIEDHSHANDLPASKETLVWVVLEVSPDENIRVVWVRFVGRKSALNKIKPGREIRHGMTDLVLCWPRSRGLNPTLNLTI